MKYLNEATASLAFLLFTFDANAQIAECSGADVITDPAPFVWTYHPASANNPEPYYSGTMEISEATFQIGGETLTTRAYGQAGQAPSIPGPTMQVLPGEKYVLKFHNKLPYETPSPDHNVFKDPNISNLHTHGLHISGESPGDDVTRSFEGGFGGDFVYDIPTDHMGGTFWYHAHHHGSTFLQVSGGAFGLLLVDDQLDGIPAHVAAMDERQVVVAFLDPAAAGTGGDTLLTGTLSSSWTVNGKIQGNICAPPNTWEHWRVLLADRNAMEKTVSVGPECEVALLARDGVWRTQAPKNLASNAISLTGASRADLAVRCSSDSTLNVNGNPVASIYVDGASGDPSIQPYASDGVSTWAALRPNYLRDLRSETSVNTESVRMGARTVNGSKFDMNEATFTLPADQVQEWSINGAAKHPFHLHVYHMQSLNCGGDFEDGEYYDVIASNCDVRFDLAEMTSSPYNGRTIMHCHILAHEDQGAMGWLDVVGGSAAPTFPVDGDVVAYSEYYSISGPPSLPNAPSSLTATAVSSSSISLSWTDNASDEGGFNIERAPGGSGAFAWVAGTASNISTWTDTGLSSATSYDYRVSAFNGAGDSAFSNTASATTDQGGQSSLVTVGSITVGTENLGRGLKVGLAVVTVIDDQGNLVSGAVVSGEFSGTFNEVIAASDPTDQAGSTRMTTTASSKGSVSVTFCVTSISHPDLQDFSAQPGEFCGNN
jgi:FtsP/CotA-like multicopper oxidase with cupredoxin domain